MSDRIGFEDRGCSGWKKHAVAAALRTAQDDRIVDGWLAGASVIP